VSYIGLGLVSKFGANSLLIVPEDHVPERGVGALLLGGLDRRVRLR
jgi:hypothetical protein